MELILLIVFVLAFQLGKHYGYYKIVKIMKEVAEEQGFDLEKELGLVKEQEESKLKVNVVRQLSVEQHGDLLYLFDKQSDEFICQGSSVQELANLAYSLKKIDLAAVLYNDKFFRFTAGKSEEFDTEIFKVISK